MLTEVNTIAVIYIAAPIGKIWAALTDPELSKLYFLGNRVEAGAVGQPFRVTRADGTRDIDGSVLTREEPHLLRVAWVLASPPPNMTLPQCEVEYRLEDLGAAVRLTVTDFVDAPPPAPFREAGRNGWGLILSGLKTWLETGKPFPAVKLSPPKAG